MLSLYMLLQCLLCDYDCNLGIVGFLATRIATTIVTWESLVFFATYTIGNLETICLLCDYWWLGNCWSCLWLRLAPWESLGVFIFFTSLRQYILYILRDPQIALWLARLEIIVLRFMDRVLTFCTYGMDDTRFTARQFTEICNRIPCNLPELHKLLVMCSVL